MKHHDMRNPQCLARAKAAAEEVRMIWFQRTGRSWPAHRKVEFGIVLGTGWRGALQLEDAVEIPLTQLQGFSGLFQLEEIPGHPRLLVIGKLCGKLVACLRGRIHLNEDPGNRELFKMVRLQTEMLLQLGAKKLIVTAGVGALPISRFGAFPDSHQVGDVLAVNGLATVFAPQMPLWSGEFCPPEDVLSPRLLEIATTVELGKGNEVSTGSYGMVLGPFFEGRKFDKQALADAGASVVGMSMLPELCVAALYKGVECLGLCFVTNDFQSAHSHESNQARARRSQKRLGALLTSVVKRA